MGLCTNISAPVCNCTDKSDSCGDVAHSSADDIMDAGEGPWLRSRSRRVYTRDNSSNRQYGGGDATVRSMSLSVHRDRTDIMGRRAQYGPLDFHTAPAGALARTGQDRAVLMMKMWSLMSSDVGLTYYGQTVCMVQSCFTSTDTISSLGRGAQVGHLDFHTAPEL